MNMGGNIKSASNTFRESRDFYDWMRGQDLSVGFAAQGVNDLILLGHHQDGSRSTCARKIDGCKKLYVDGPTFWISTRNHLWQFENCLGQRPSALGSDRMYVPMLGITTGEIGVEDIVVEAHGRVVFASSCNGCLATISELNRVVPFWRPSVNVSVIDVESSFLSGLAAEDGYSKYVTAFDRTRRPSRWNFRGIGHGYVIDIDSNEIIATNLSMPHSPRIHDGLLWLLNSGTGHFGFVDLATGKFQDVLSFQGSLDCLAFHGDYAVIGLSGSREHFSTYHSDRDFDWNKSSDAERCQIQIIDMRRGVATSSFAVPPGVCRLNDVVILPGVKLPGVVRPQAVGFDLDPRDDWFQTGSDDRWNQISVT